MTRAKISQLDAAAANNTDINAVNVAEGCPPSGINNAIREMGAMLKRMDNGTDHLTDPNITGSLDVDNIKIDGNTISSSNTNGNINITPNGTGAVAFTTNATFGDNDKAIFGAGSDLQIYHDGSASIVYDNGTGPLNLQTNNSNINIKGGGSASDTMAIFKSTEGVDLYYNNVKKFETSSTGCSVTGGVVASGGLSIDSYGDPSNNYITLRPSVAPSASGGVGFAAKDHDGANNDGLGVFGHDGISFTTGGSERLRMTSAGLVGIGTSSPEAKLDIVGNSDSIAALKIGPNANFGHHFYDSSTNGDLVIKREESGTQSETMRLTRSGGNVLIGDSAPQVVSKLTVSGNGSANTGTFMYDGSAGTYFDINTNAANGIVSLEANARSGNFPPLTFITGGSERLRMTSAGKIGINTSSPTGILEINGSDNALLAMRTTGDAAQQVMGTQYLNNSGAVTAQTFATGDSSSSSVFRIKAIGSIDLIGGDIGVTGAAADLRVAADGNVSVANNLAVTGSVSKGSGSFKIDHPLPSKKDTHDLVHSFIEGPQADLIYRGRATLSGGTVDVNVDTAAGMTEGTFVLLCNNVQCFTSNEEGWTALRGSVTGNVLTITAQDNTCTDTVSWMVIGERKDTHMLDTEWTDENGKVIVEPTKLT